MLTGISGDAFWGAHRAGASFDVHVHFHVLCLAACTSPRQGERAVAAPTSTLEGEIHGTLGEHVVGVKDGEKLYKVQVLSYYGERAGAPISALYSIRWAELGPTGPGPTRTLEGIDGTAGGAGGADTEPNEVVDLATGSKSLLSKDSALASSSWHLSFRRQTVTVNGGIAGPRGATAYDLDEPSRSQETLDTVRERTAESERARFESVTRASFDGKPFRAEGIVSAFGDAWVERSGQTPSPTYATWLVADARGQRFLLGFSRFVSATTTSPGTVVMHRKPVPN